VISAARVLLLGGCLSGCAHTVAYPPEPPLLRDPDRRPFHAKLESYYSSGEWDFLEKSYLRPVTRFLAVDPGGEAVNLNTLDEVPNSSWFENRVERLAADDFALGPCDTLDLKLEGTRIVAGKPDGVYPGFMVKDSSGKRYMLKVDGGIQGPHNSSADVVGSRLYYAAGFDVPCNRVVRIQRSALVIDAKAKMDRANGEETPMVDADVDEILARGQRERDGSWRAVASRYLDGRPIGPWRYHGTRDGDRNDIVPHEDRRELRGARLMAAWTNHWDSREQNTLAMWIETRPGEGYVRHHLLDFGDCFGTFAGATATIVKRRGHVHWFEPGEVLSDFATLGLIQRPWDKAKLGPTGPFLGYYDVELFEADAWMPNYPNPAFGRMTERDAAWMARIIAQMDERDLHAAVSTARLDQRISDEWVRVLMGRRQKILSRYLTRVSPLAQPELVVSGRGTWLCTRDLAFETGIVKRRRYRARIAQDGAWDASAAAQPTVDARGRVCVQLPVSPRASASVARPTYLAVEIATESSALRAGPARFHVYQKGPSSYLLAGIERLEN
jgi:hypothetical protein